MSLVAGWALPGSDPSLHVRLTTPLTSYGSAAGSEFQAVVIAPYVRQGRVVVPQGTIVFGTVKKARNVGLGLFRERASIDLTFHHYELPDGRRFPIRATLLNIDNARETVSRKGSVNGILAANNPQSLIQGVWHRPRLLHFPRSFVGLTGAGGRIASAYSLGPIGSAALFAIRLTMFRLPEPEIQLPAGIDMHLTDVKISASAPTSPVDNPEVVQTHVADWLSDIPSAVTRPGGDATDDLINLAFIGSQEQIVNAFRAAGWYEADPLTARTFSRAYQSYTRQIGYPTAPVSKLLYGGAEPDLVFQKSFNTITRRHHIRLWRVQDGDHDYWLGAATHDIGIEFNKRAMTFSHKIDKYVDRERTKIINDLRYVDCAEDPQYVDRPELAQIKRNAKDIITDGRLALLTLKDCEDTPQEEPVAPTPPQSRLGRIARRMMLEGRQYALRGNAYYWTYRALTYRRASKVQPEAVDE
jgi:hypothetical protein